MKINIPALVGVAVGLAPYVVASLPTLAKVFREIRRNLEDKIREAWDAVNDGPETIDSVASEPREAEHSVMDVEALDLGVTDADSYINCGNRDTAHEIRVPRGSEVTVWYDRGVMDSVNITFPSKPQPAIQSVDDATAADDAGCDTGCPCKREPVEADAA